MGLQGRFNLMLEEQYDESSEFVSVSVGLSIPKVLANRMIDVSARTGFA